LGDKGRRNAVREVTAEEEEEAVKVAKVGDANEEP
jgi:hypothetical protein